LASVTAVQLPLNDPQLPPDKVAESRSTTCVVESRPEPPSEPQSIVSGTEAVGYHGPPASEADCPLGAVEAALMVSEPLPLRPAPFVAMIVVDPSELAPAVQA